MQQQVSKIDSLTGIRGFAALWVVLHHYPFQSGAYPYSLLNLGVFNPIAVYGYLGVDLFFVLSGFIIAYVYQQQFVQSRRKHAMRFLGLRLARIYPVHLFMLGVGVLNFIALQLISKGQLPQPKDMYTAQQLLVAVLNMHAWGFPGGNWNGPSWTISAEWFAYLMFPLLAGFWGTTFKSSKTFWLVLGLGLTALVFYLGLPEVDSILRDQPLVRVMLGFLAGQIVFNLYQSQPAPDNRWDSVAVLSLVAVLALVYLMPSYLLMTLCFAVFIYSLSRSGGFIHQFFSRPGLVYLGEVSYSLYLVHGIFLLGWAGIFMRKVLVPANAGLPWHLLMFIGFMLAIWFSAQWLYKTIELPARNYLREKINQRFQPEVSQP